mmetsp:Transcript_52538/g.115244  ORF Transcript_52538/g.115244 Transcript_52538/m.115244 type:complete len:138 (+) Transcript_52538:78-491(+)
MLKAWEAELLSKTDQEDPALKQDRALYRQSRTFMKPLRRRLKKSDGIESAILDRLHAIVTLCSDRKYREASTEYMRLAIGNMAWPMGVTKVTFHDRKNRSLISEDAMQAHVLNDETTRRYVQTFKRLMTTCEQRFPA